MVRTLFFVASIVFGLNTPAGFAEVKDFAPVTREMLLNPSPDDWLMFSRTYDAQRFSPLNQINRQNVGQLSLVWGRGMGPGTQEVIPLVYRGVMYVINPGAVVQALDATNGDLLWEYGRKLPDDLAEKTGPPIARNLAIYEDLIFYTAPDGYVVALDARTGALRWETQAHDYKTETRHTSGPIVVEGKVITGRACAARVGCFIAAHDARTGKELWKFYTTAAPGEPGGDSWGNLPVDKRISSPWGFPTYDATRKLVYWGTGNPKPFSRMKRHSGNPDAVPRSAPSELYTNSTVALDPDTGKLAWYYQHLPGDDYGSDDAYERILLRTPINPDPQAVKWINPRIPRGQERDITVSVGKTGGSWVNDRDKGEFLWATPFPYDTPNFHISRVDVETGKTYLNGDLIFKKDGEKYTVCFADAKGYWPMAYHPAKNSLYVPYTDFCSERTAEMQRGNGYSAKAVPRAGSDPVNALAGIAKVNMATGQIQRFHTARVPGNGAMLATAGDLIFWGDMNRRFKAFDADTGKILWETILGGIIQNSTITYAVNGRQYIAVLTGDGLGLTTGLLAMVPEIKTPRGHNAINVFALPGQR